MLTTLLVPLGKTALGAAFALGVARQCRKPFTRAGRLFLHSMNASHAGVTQWGISHIEVGKTFTILDIGCGGGRTVSTLASLTVDGRVFGIDHSDQSVAVARDTNKASIASGQVGIQLGSVSHLPFADGTFDLVIAVETHYYWPDLPNDVEEVMRALKPGGTFLLIAETYRGRTKDWLYWPVMRLLLRAAYMTPDEHRDLLGEAGYKDVRVFEEKSRGWICAVGRR